MHFEDYWKCILKQFSIILWAGREIDKRNRIFSTTFHENLRDRGYRVYSDLSIEIGVLIKVVAAYCLCRSVAWWWCTFCGVKLHSPRPLPFTCHISKKNRKKQIFRKFSQLFATFGAWNGPNTIRNGPKRGKTVRKRHEMMQNTTKMERNNAKTVRKQSKTVRLE